MESIQDNHDRRVFELSLFAFNFRLLSAIALSKTKFLTFGWPLNRGKDNNENPYRNDQMVAAEVTGQ